SPGPAPPRAKCIAVDRTDPRPCYLWRRWSDVFFCQLSVDIRTIRRNEMAETDYVELAATLTRDEFVSSCRFPFLLGSGNFNRPDGPRPTVRFPAESTAPGTRATETAQRRSTGLSHDIVIPIRKVHDVFPGMITVGRTANNDIVISDVEVSKFHAIF